MAEDNFPPTDLFSDHNANVSACTSCGFPQSKESQVCTQCGLKIESYSGVGRPLDLHMIKVTSLFLGNILLLSIAILFNDLQTDTSIQFLGSLMLLISAVGVASFSPEIGKEIFSFKAIELRNLILGISGAAILAIGFYAFSRWIFPNKMFEIARLTTPFKDAWNPLIMSLIFYSIVLPLSEEVFFRGVIQSLLNKVMSVRGAIFSTSILFVFIHLNPVAILWLLPLGLFLSYLRHRSGSIWESFVAYSVYNSIVIFMQENYYPHFEYYSHFEY